MLKGMKVDHRLFCIARMRKARGAILRAPGRHALKRRIFQGCRNIGRLARIDGHPPRESSTLAGCADLGGGSRAAHPASRWNRSTCRAVWNGFVVAQGRAGDAVVTEPNPALPIARRRSHRRCAGGACLLTGWSLGGRRAWKKLDGIQACHSEKLYLRG